MNKNPITLLEYQESLPLKEKERKELYKLNKLLGENVFTITPNNGIKAKQFVGVCQVGNKTIEILPKILSTNNGDSNIRKNLLYMLSYTKKLKLKESQISTLSKQDNLFEAIIYLYAKNLLELLKLDLVRNYQKKEENTPYLKGKLLIKKHLKYNLFNKAKFYSQYDEFSENNLLNQVFKVTTNKLIKKTNNSKNFKLLQECDFILQDVELKTIQYRELKQVTFHRLNIQYKDIFNLAKILLFGNSVDLQSKDTNTYSILFDMNKLFEEFIFENIKKISDKNIQSEKPQTHLFNTPPKFYLKPDITINCVKNSNNEYSCEKIIDTKYKKVNNNANDKYGVSTQDVYQMFTYSKMYNCKEIMLLYPKSEEEVDKRLENGELTIKIKTIDLHINLIENKDNLKKKIKNLLK